MSEFTNEEISTAKQIIASGLEKAAESLSFFMRETISLSESEFTISNEENIAINLNAQEELYVLTTEMKGEMKGVCYLVINKEERDEICKVALPKEIYSNPDKLSAMQEPLLLEIDNIISASVVTQIANRLKRKVYGDVPRLNIMTTEDLKKTIVKEMRPNKLILGFQTEFQSSKSHFHPEFFWILEPDFIECVKMELFQKTS